MRTRKELVKFIEQQLKTGASNDLEFCRNHYGRRDFHQMLDYLYESSPQEKEEELMVNRAGII